jgi:hypothetical protein
VLEDPALGEYWDAAGAWLTGRTSDYQGVWPLPFMPAAERAEQMLKDTGWLPAPLRAGGDA